MDEENVEYVNDQTVNFSEVDAIILPVHGTSDQGEITSSYSNHSFFITKKLIDTTPDHCIIYTGIANDFLKDAVKNRQMEIIFARDDIAIYNSISTAEATLQLAIQHTDYTIHGANIAVLGFGRVGMTMARLFHNVGANITAFARKSSDIARMEELCIHADYLYNLNDRMMEFSLCINTIPHLVLNREILDVMDTNTLIIDVASAPGGTNFSYAEKKGLHVIHALGLPGKTAPKSAGKILASTILNLMKENNS